MTPALRLFANPRRAAHLVRRWTRPLWRSSDRACVALGLGTFLLCACVSLALGPPPPSIHDEFSYLLAGDTFARGRLTNPTHPLWEHFETFHVLPRPTYQSKYQPAPGFFLAAGQVLSGFPSVGVWLSLGLAAAAVGWMLRAFLPPGWSFLGALLLATSPLVVVRWGDSYWGGGVPLLGAALVMGAAGRLCRQERARDGFLLALGLFLLFESRPFEGALASIPALVLLGVSRWRARTRPAPGWRGPVLAFATTAAAGAAFVGYYDARVTGSPWTLPYVAYLREYSNVPLTGWGPLEGHRAYRHVAFDRFYREHAEKIYYDTSVSPTRWRLKLLLVRGFVFRPFIGWSLLLPLLLSLWRPRPAVLMALAACILVLAGNVMSLWVFSHYFAPAGAALYLLITVGLRRLMAVRGALGAVLVAAVALATAVEAAQNYRTELLRVQFKRQGWAGTRSRVERDLRALPGLDLVVVRYAPDQSVHQEWVYNGADIDASPVVWAREMDGASNRRLLEYFGKRHAWLLEVGPSRVVITPYPGDSNPSAPGAQGGPRQWSPAAVPPTSP